MPATTFRFKFSQNFMEKLHAFSQVHRYDNRHIFKEAWERWCEENNDSIQEETALLENNGYHGPVLDKMYKSARYYFSKKKNEQAEPKQRRRYVSVDGDLIDQMDNHILDWCRREDFKPATAFSDFCVSHKSLLDKEVLRLYADENLTEEEIPIKLKKTYKNRYFQRVKAPLVA